MILNLSILLLLLIINQATNNAKKLTNSYLIDA